MIINANGQVAAMHFNFDDNRVVSVNCPDLDSLMRQVSGLLATRQGFALATLNVDHLERLAKDDAFLRAYAEHDLVVADGNPVVWLSKLAGQPVQLVPGSDLVRPLAAMAAEQGVPLALVGGNEASMTSAAARLSKEHPDLTIAMIAVPGFPFDPDGAEAEALIQQIGRSGAGLCFLGLGAPRQERFAIRARNALPQVGFVSIGAGLDFISGQQKRAPKAIRRIKMEWMWRMLSNPKRLAGRYGRGFLILPGHAVRALSQRRG